MLPYTTLIRFSVNWPEYQKMMTGRAFLLSYNPHSADCVNKDLCHYPPPVVPPIELEILPDKIPVDHSWGPKQAVPDPTKNDKDSNTSTTTLTRSQPGRACSTPNDKKLNTATNRGRKSKPRRRGRGRVQSGPLGQ